MGEKIKTHFALNYFFPCNCVVYEIKLKYLVHPGRPQMARRHIRFACWITKATNTHLEYLVLLAVVWQQLLGECLGVKFIRNLCVLFFVLMLIAASVYK